MNRKSVGTKTFSITIQNSDGHLITDVWRGIIVNLTPE
jgi:hypothetical protein